MPRRFRPHPLDGVAVGLLAAGGGCVATGLLPVSAAGDVLRRALPLLLFLASVIVLAELTAAAEVFDVVAARLAIAGRGRYPAIFALCVGFAAVTTAVLNLDTTAVLLTPVMLALAGRVGLPPVPAAMTTVWLANTASLLLPVSNLTNLLAQDRAGLGPAAFAGRMWAAELVSVGCTAACLWGFYWRRGARTAGSPPVGAPDAGLTAAELPDAGRYRPPAPHAVGDRLTFRVAAAACVAFAAAILLLDVQLWVASAICAAPVVAAFAVRRRAALRPSLLPWRLLVLVTGLFLVIETISRHGLTGALQHLVGTDQGAGGLVRTAFTGAGAANLVNNLPAYLAGEPAVAAGHHTQLLALLVGVNVGSIVTPWASLATLLWYERCAAAGVRVPVLRFVATGAVLAVVGVAASAAVLAL